MSVEVAIYLNRYYTALNKLKVKLRLQGDCRIVVKKYLCYYSLTNIFNPKVRRQQNQEKLHLFDKQMNKCTFSSWHQ